MPAEAEPSAFPRSPAVDRVVAPFITSWSTEHDVPARLVEIPGRGLAYADELLTNRDSRGVLWRQTVARRGVGRPLFSEVHPMRQRRAMTRLLCQVCGKPADRTEGGVLWLMRDHRDDWPDWPDGLASVEPPVCLQCVGVSLRLCPALRRGAVAVRVREFPVVGVRGVLYQRGSAAPVAVEAANFSYDDPAVRWVRASALVRELRSCAVVPLQLLSTMELQ